jgi:hypothetical protein
VYGHYQIQADFTLVKTFHRDTYGTPGAANLFATVPDKNDNPKQVELFMAQPMQGSTEIVDQYNQDTGTIRMYGGNLTYSGGDADLDWGTLFDWYWVSSDTGGAVYAELLDTFPAAGDRTFVAVGRIGQVAIGWLDDSATDLKYTEL